MEGTTELLGMMEALLRKMDVIERIYAPKREPLTIEAFAKKVGRSRWTIQRWIKAGKVQRVRGLIPASELDRYLS